MANIIDFNHKPSQIIPYNFGDVVTRENFINFLVLSFALSRGSFVLQKVFFKMMEHKAGFPYQSTIEAFYNAGSFDALSHKEQELIVTAFRGVKAHMEKYEEIEIMDEIRDELMGMFERPEEDGKASLGAALSFFEFDTIKTVPEFMSTATEFHKKWRDSLN